MIMKKLFFSLVALVIATVSYAQSTLVATLTHGDEIKMFYGVKALQQAHAAAVDGDIINLSGGRFEMASNGGGDITKGITIRGTGVDASNPTIIVNNCYIKLPDSVTERLSIEGCRFQCHVYVEGNLTNAYFLKCYFYWTYYARGNDRNTMFVNCRFGKFEVNNNGSKTHQFVNCNISDYNDYNGGASSKFINCVVFPIISSGSYIKNSELVNCVIVYNGQNGNPKLSSSNTARNCVACGSVIGKDIRENYKDLFDNLAFKQNCSLAGMDIFVDSNPENDLTDEAKATYLGNDGTPVGMYGGPFPFSWTPTYPQITKMNVANKTTADGKLSVEIEVSATE